MIAFPSVVIFPISGFDFTFAEFNSQITTRVIIPYMVTTAFHLEHVQIIVSTPTVNRMKPEFTTKP